jgi:hypothetical protein
MQFRLKSDEIARRVIPVLWRHGIERVMLIPRDKANVVDEEGHMHLLLDTNGSEESTDFDALLDELEAAVGCPVQVYTLENMRHNPYGKDVIRSAVMLTTDDQ